MTLTVSGTDWYRAKLGGAPPWLIESMARSVTAEQLPTFFPELEPSYQVSITSGAMRTIREEIRRNGRSTETGGWLFAHAGDSNSVVLATGPGGDGRSGYATMEIGYEDWDAVKRLAPHLAPVGDWHLHPTADTMPSRQDRRAWGRGCELTGSQWLGLVFAPPADMWSEAECASFITFGTKTTKGCEPLRLVEF
jgi:hypothetical protein